MLQHHSCLKNHGDNHSFLLGIPTNIYLWCSNIFDTSFQGKQSHWFLNIIQVFTQNIGDKLFINDNFYYYTP